MAALEPEHAASQSDGADIIWTSDMHELGEWRTLPQLTSLAIAHAHMLHKFPCGN